MRAKKKYGFDPEYAVPPGETLRETMTSLQMTQKELADRLGLTVQTLNRIFEGVQPITYETANRLELVTGIPARLWNNLEMQFQEDKSKLEEKKRFESDVNWLKTIPVKELVSRGLVENDNVKSLLLRSVLAFYGVSSVGAWGEIWINPSVAARRSTCFETQPGSASAWIRQGELKALDMEYEPYDRKKFQIALSNIRGLTNNEPEDFISKMQNLCAKSGVALVFVRDMKKVPWNGATKWLSPDKAMIILSLRGKFEDKFWFSFFHEAGHVLNGSKKRLYIAGNSSDPDEKEADRFAADFLIPEKFNDRIRNCSSKADIIRIANELDIAPGIVAGRYQFLTKQYDFFKGLIRKCDWVED